MNAWVFFLFHDANTYPSSSIQSPFHYNLAYPWCDPTRGFSWAHYHEHCRSRAAPARAFVGSGGGSGSDDPFPQAALAAFEVGMKLEAVDPEHQALVCIVTVAEIRGKWAMLSCHCY